MSRLLGDRVHDEALSTVLEGGSIELSFPIRNADRTVGARLGGAIARIHGRGTPKGSALVQFEGEAGQSFGAFLTHGVEFQLKGEANDYVGKGMGGGRIVIVPPEEDAGDPYLVGNTVLYGATGGELFVAGRGGERFGVRNSGATALIEGTGDHSCEYMTGGTIVILGKTGWNLGAGMTGGQAFVWDPELQLPARVNPELVDMHRVNDDHEADLLELIAQHVELTSSERGLQILEQWQDERSNFWRIAPKAGVASIESHHEGSLAAKE